MDSATASWRSNLLLFAGIHSVREKYGSRQFKISGFQRTESEWNWVVSWLPIITTYTKWADFVGRRVGFFFLRNFNNWLKNLGCGKGGDLNKWRKLPIGHMIFADIADISVKQAQARYKELVQRYGGREPFNVEFLTADCTKDIIKDKFQNPDHQFHLQSESRKSQHQIAGKLEIVFYSVEFEEPLTEETTLPLFGAKYNFHLEGVVDCPEFLVHFPTFIKIAEKYGLILVAKRRFSSYFNEMKGKGGDLLERMDALETYKKGYDNSKSNFEQYKAAEAFFDSNKQAHILGTLSKDEWEAINIYLVFAFKKMI
ncbi:RNMT [Lepeophtheirus salmonis]|uniref:mRNA (guanine-N(7))-methyltransferase n=1 Tax=Lepeophtheirus salmonis TaxID=72036 RepID=A0A7R8D308_LEPSM|nr:RNMT [Lepeophtheirus salmonis]CAF2980631.1 RNMT [Lepeophtheirus salmonis]